jgi:hypothetical protein
MQKFRTEITLYFVLIRIRGNGGHWKWFGDGVRGLRLMDHVPQAAVMYGATTQYQLIINVKPMHSTLT